MERLVDPHCMPAVSCSVLSYASAQSAQQSSSNSGCIPNTFGPKLGGDGHEASQLRSELRTRSSIHCRLRITPLVVRSVLICRPIPQSQFEKMVGGGKAGKGTSALRSERVCSDGDQCDGEGRIDGDRCIDLVG